MKKRAKKIIRIVLLVGTLVSMFFVPWALVWAWVLPIPDTIQEQADQAIRHGFDGIIIYIDEFGQRPEFYAAGWHDRGKKIPANPHALFKIASIEKLYDAVAITKLVRDGRLSLDGTLIDYFPELADRIEYADRITLRMMVQHRSGIPNLSDAIGFWTNPPKDSMEALELALDLPANFEPDQKYQYSNTNYLLISELIGRILGYSKYQYLAEIILNPLGLNRTFGSIHEVDSAEIMSGYYVGIEEDLKKNDYGSMIATAEDVGIFLRKLNNGSFFDVEEQEIYSSIYVYEHSGLVPGYQSIARYYKDIDAVVIQFVNTTNFDGYTWSVSEIVFDRILTILRRRRKS